jgi:arylsulfatase A-like enzyme
MDIELYDRRQDPEEMVNLALDPEYAAQLRRLQSQLAKRIAEATKHPEGLKFIPPEPGDRGVSKVDTYF